MEQMLSKCSLDDNSSDNGKRATLDVSRGNNTSTDPIVSRDSDVGLTAAHVELAAELVVTQNSTDFPSTSTDSPDGVSTSSQLPVFNVLQAADASVVSEVGKSVTPEMHKQKGKCHRSAKKKEASDIKQSMLFCPSILVR
jgi:hypothetical protein